MLCGACVDVVPVLIRLLVLVLTNKIHCSSSCEIEYFVENHICKLCVILPSLVLLGVCVLLKEYRSATPLRTSSYRVSRVVLISLCTETVNHVFQLNM